MLLAIASTLRLRHEKYYQSGQLNTKYSTHKEGRYTSEKSGLIYHHQKRKQHQGQRNTLSFHIARVCFEKKNHFISILSLPIMKNPKNQE